jgi:hypothetical protein
MTQLKTYAKPSDLLDDLNSHDIVNVQILQQCEFDTSMIPTFTMKQTIASIKRRGLGGHLEGAESDVLIYGWTTARALAVKLLGNAPGDRFHGRGSAFRADKAALREAGF